MQERWRILADDLTGAADAATEFARRGVQTWVTWGEPNTRNCGAAVVLAYDCDSRRLGARAAAQQQRAAVIRLRAECAPHAVLFKKIDSTLRGQPAAEIAALCSAVNVPGKSAFGICAPANPSMGRTLRDGRVWVHGEPLENTETWLREHNYPDADLVTIVASAGLRAIKLPLGQVRAGPAALRAALAATAAPASDGAGTAGLAQACAMCRSPRGCCQATMRGCARAWRSTSAPRSSGASTCWSRCRSKRNPIWLRVRRWRVR